MKKQQPKPKHRAPAPAPMPAPPPDASHTSIIFRSLTKAHRLQLEALGRRFGIATLSGALVELLNRYPQEHAQAAQDRRVLLELEADATELRDVNRRRLQNEVKEVELQQRTLGRLPYVRTVNRQTSID